MELNLNLLLARPTEARPDISRALGLRLQGLSTKFTVVPPPPPTTINSLLVHCSHMTMSTLSTLLALARNLLAKQSLSTNSSLVARDVFIFFSFILIPHI